MDDHAPGDWSEYQRLVLSDLRALKDEITSLRDELKAGKQEHSSTVNDERREREAADDRILEEVRRLDKETGRDILVLMTKAALLGAGAGLIFPAIELMVRLLGPAK